MEEGGKRKKVEEGKERRGSRIKEEEEGRRKEVEVGRRKEGRLKEEGKEKGGGRWINAGEASRFL